MIELMDYQIQGFASVLPVRRQARIVSVSVEDRIAIGLLDGRGLPIAFHELPRQPKVGDRLEVTLRLAGERFLKHEYRLLEDLLPADWKKEGF